MTPVPTLLVIADEASILHFFPPPSPPPPAPPPPAAAPAGGVDRGPVARRARAEFPPLSSG